MRKATEMTALHAREDAQGEDGATDWRCVVASDDRPSTCIEQHDGRSDIM